MPGLAHLKKTQIPTYELNTAVTKYKSSIKQASKLQWQLR